MEARDNLSKKDTSDLNSNKYVREDYGIVERNFIYING